MLTVAARLVLFVSSYSPLLFLFAILDSLGRGWASIICASVAGVSIALLVAVWLLLLRGAGDWLPLKNSKSQDKEVMSFFVTYVVPFAAAQDGSSKSRWALLLFAVIVAALYLRSAIFYIHPLLLLAGYHVLDATTELDTPVTVLTRRRSVRQRERLWTVRIALGVYVEKGQ